MPFYRLDGALTAAYPHVPLFENQGLSIAERRLAYFGLVGADRRPTPIARCLIEASYAERV